MGMLNHRTTAAVTVVLVLLLGSTVAAHNGVLEPGIIHACKLLSKGTIRIIGATEACKTGEVSLDWNAVGPQGPQGPKGDTGPQGPSALINLQTFTSYNIDSTIGTEKFVQLPEPIFVYSKQKDTSFLKITYQDTINASNGACNYQVRVDGQASVPNTFSPPILIGLSIGTTSLSSMGIFHGLSAGSHEITFWHRQVGATECNRNSGGYVTTVIVEEFE